MDSFFLDQALPPVKQLSSTRTPESMARSLLHKGSGWRLGWDPTGQPFVALVGGETWALELTRDEWRTFVKGLQCLQQDMEAIGSQLMAEESITLEQVFATLTLIANGSSAAWSLYLQLHQGRRGEGFWPADAVPELCQAVAQWLALERD